MDKGHRQTRAVVAIGILLACCACAFALDPSLDVSQYAHTTWKFRDGITKGAVFSIAQTPDGYLWLGTEFGLVRFDGTRAVPWQPSENQHLPSGAIYALLVSRDGTFWIGTWTGLASWKDGKVTRYPELDGEAVFSLLEDHDGTVWAGAGGTPIAGKLCAIRGSSVDCFGGDGRLGPAVVALLEDRNGNLWAGVKDGLWRWKPGPPKFYSLPGQPSGIRALAEDPGGALLIGWRGGISQFANGKMERYPLPGLTRRFRANRILRDRDGSLWIGTLESGLVHIHERRTDAFSTVDGLSGENTYPQFEDREGNIWVSTVEGLDRFHDLAVATLTKKQGLSRALVGSILSDKNGSVWLATYGGLNRWDHGQISTPSTGGAKREGKLDGSDPNSLFQDSKGRIWVSTLRELGYLENGRFVSIKGIPDGSILSIAQDAAGNVWVINERAGLVRVSPQNDVREILWADLGHKDHASVLAADRRQGGLWIGFFLGGIAYFTEGQIRASYTAADGLGAGRISDFRLDDSGTLWVSTEGGLSRLKNNRVDTLNSKNGLPCDTVHWSIEDDDRSFWLYTTCGLVRIARSELDAWAADVEMRQGATRPIRVTVFDSSDGVRSLADVGHYHPHVAKTPDGRLWFLPWDGVSVIDPHHLAFNKLPPPVHIEQVTADRKTYWQNLTGDASSSRSSSSQPRLPPLVRDLTIDYTALSFVAPEKVLFRYKLEGRDPDWQNVGARRQAFYNDLSRGNYRFRVAACNNSGVWNEAGTFLDFSIAPAYYQTTWFRVSCVAALLVLLWGIYRLRVQQLQHQFAIGLEARVNERTRIARELHDTLLQSFQGLMLRFQTVGEMLPARPLDAKNALEGALDRADEAISEGRDAITDIRATTLASRDLEKSITALMTNLSEELAASNGRSVTFRVLVEGVPRAVRPTLQDEIYRIARESLRNAFRHAQAGHIETEIMYGESLRLRFRDDGKGIDPSVVEHGGRSGHWGLPGIRERAKQIGAQLTVWSELGAGTEVELSIPGSIAYEVVPGARFRIFRKRTEQDHEHRS
jgi:signal transduction histidine kinase/ligand-binding sensor domain-containing protein